MEKMEIQKIARKQNLEIWTKSPSIRTVLISFFVMVYECDVGIMLGNVSKMVVPLV